MRYRLRDLLPTGREKGPGYGIVPDYYVSVLSTKSVSPALLEVVNPRAQGGAVAGFGIPMDDDKDKDSLALPMTRGFYGIASPDQKTLLKLAVMPVQESGFSTEAVLASADFEPETHDRIAAAWTIFQLTWGSFTPSVVPSLVFFLCVAQKLAELGAGVIADPLSRRYLLPDQLRSPADPAGKLDPRDLVSVLDIGDAYMSFGFAKIGQPELKAATDSPLIEPLVMGLAAKVIEGKMLAPGDQCGSPECPIQIALAGAEGLLELVPPTGSSMDTALDAWWERAKMNP